MQGKTFIIDLLLINPNSKKIKINKNNFNVYSSVRKEDEKKISNLSGIINFCRR